MEQSAALRRCVQSVSGGFETKWKEIEQQWPALKEKVAARFDGLPPEELKKTQGGRRELLQLIEATYGKADPKAEQDLDNIMKGENNG